MTDAHQPNTGTEGDLFGESPPGLPQWVKVVGIVVGVLLMVMLIATLAGGNHGPGRHLGTPSLGRDVSGPVSVRW